MVDILCLVVGSMPGFVVTGILDTVEFLSSINIEAVASVLGGTEIDVKQNSFNNMVKLH